MNLKESRPKSPLRARSPPQTAARRAELQSKKDELPANVHEVEFGGPVGAGAIMVFSHVILYYMWLANTFYEGQPFWPSWRALELVREHAAPTWSAAIIYTAFLAAETLFAAAFPGPDVEGLPVPSENNRVLIYRCNAVPAWYVTLIIAGGLHVSGLFPLGRVIDELGSLMTVAVIAGNVVSVLTYLAAFTHRVALRVTGNPVYDFFMGVYLNPRLGRVDLKMWAEIRVSWTVLFLLTVSSAVRQYELHGAVSYSMMLMVLAHFLYANACQKGEEMIPTTWDIFYENWGWMLIFWNLAGVPFLYCFQSVYLINHDPGLSAPVATALAVALLAAYYVWDTANSQKNRFRMILRGRYVPRRTFPQLPWGTVENPRYLATQAGSALLTDGWYAYARKPHYTADIVMALIWGLTTGFASVLPYFYVCFFLGMILHRAERDNARCSKKYGDDWVTYCNTVPSTLLPGVY